MKPKKPNIIPTVLKKPKTRALKPEEFQEFEYPVLEAYQDENGYYHNENAPAIITEQTSYFIEHGVDWDKETYETFIRNTAQKLFPNDEINSYPFTQIESLVLTSKGWGRREKLYLSPPYTGAFRSPHTLIMGKPGSGKTVILDPRANLFQKYQAQTVIYLDPKTGYTSLSQPSPKKNP